MSFMFSLIAESALSCCQLLPVKQTLTECSSCDQTRQEYYVHTNLKHIFDHSPIKNILDFIKIIHVYDNM